MLRLKHKVIGVVLMKRVIGFILVTAMLIALFGCDSEPEVSSTQEVSSETVSVVEVSSEEETSSEEGFVEVFSSEVPIEIDYEYERLTTLQGLNIVNFGDSIYGIWRNETSVSGQLASLTGATCHNAGIGGATFAFAWNHSDYFTMHRMATFVSKEDFNPMKRTIDMFVREQNPNSNAIPTYEVLKAIDWDKVDVITINYGTNDFTNNNLITGNEDETQRINHTKANPDLGLYSPCEHYYLDDAVKYTLNAIRSAHPHIRIVVLTPVQRFDVEPYNRLGYQLSDYAEHIKKVCEEWGVPCFDLYNDCDINAENVDIYFDAPDLVHPNGRGRGVIAQYMADHLLEALNSYCK
jgi:lysophospholipase L1-like esterase